MQQSKLPSFSQLKKTATTPKFLQSKSHKPTPKFLRKKATSAQVKEIIEPAPLPPKEKPKTEPKLSRTKVEKLEKLEKLESVEKAPIVYEEAVKKIESSNRIYKKIDRKEEIRKEKESKKNQRITYRSNLNELGFNAEAYYYLQHDLNLED
eukprot:TRINITY_DN3249_c0_g1_i6.p1 TRINITY_DN3249_c0_g1~~TRINITY_DN3249_c0_g1_i6.p1  ORF type:complete len:151 (-),score=61.83 TRINITY_DN3249_c0_g1_i6:112-564(-)